MVTNGVANLPVDGTYIKSELRQPAPAVNQFSTALEAEPSTVSKETNPPTSSGLSSLYQDEASSSGVGEAAYKVWGFAQDVVANFARPTAVPLNSQEKPAEIAAPSGSISSQGLQPAGTTGNNPFSASQASSKDSQKSFWVETLYGDEQATEETVPVEENNGSSPSSQAANPQPQQVVNQQYDPVTGQPLYPVDQSSYQGSGQQYDPVTGQPLYPVDQSSYQGYGQQYDPITGQPLYPVDQSSYQGSGQQYDPVTGQPLYPIAQNSYQGSGQQYDPVTGLPISWLPSADGSTNFESAYYWPPIDVQSGGTWSQGLYGDILGNYFGGQVPQGGSDTTAGLQFAPGYYY